MTTLSLIRRKRFELSKILTEKKLTYSSINELGDLCTKILIEECKKLSLKMEIDSESKILLNRCFEYIYLAIEDINKLKVVESATKIRDSFESLFAIISKDKNNNFILDMDSRTGDMIRFISDNVENIFGEIDFIYYDGLKKGNKISEFKVFYDWISKIIHPTSLKLLVINLENDLKVNKYYSNVFKSNILYLVYITLNYLQKNASDGFDDDFIIEISKILMCVELMNMVYFGASISKDKIKNYSQLFASEFDQNYIKNISDNANKNKIEYDKIIAGENFKVIDAKFIEDELSKREYLNLFNLEINSIISSIK